METMVVIGGGAAGFFGAIACAEAAPGRRVVLLEKGRRLLAKVLVSGGGRCNVTHACFDPAVLVKNYPRGGPALRGPLTRFQPRDTVAWFAARGVALKTEEDGRIFPVSDASQTIVDCLTREAAKTGVEVRTGVDVASIVPDPAGGFRLAVTDGSEVLCRRLLLATGSNREAYGWASSLGHTIEPPVPSLFTFNVKDRRLEGLAGIAVEDGRISLPKKVLSQTGPLLITHWGLSGPAALKLSAWGARVLFEAGYKTSLQVSWVADDRTTVLAGLKALKAAHPRKQIASHAAFDLPQRLWERLAGAAGIAPDLRWADASRGALEGLAGELSEGLYQMSGKGVFKEEFVTCGGVRLDEVDFRTMESRARPGLHFAGEILDVDGVTGGFNFQNAWTTGWLAGKAMAADLGPDRFG